MNVQHMFLPHCWICERKFAQHGGAPDMLEERHHLIPRAYGGTDGPQVSLCNGHHSLVHLVGNRLIADDRNGVYNLVKKETQVQAQKVMYLGSRIQLAEAEVSNDPNKRVLVPISMDKRTRGMLKEICKFHGGKSAEAVLIRLVQQHHSQLFLRQD